jgi:hypothetical protein
MLEADVAELVGQRDQELVFIIMFGAGELERLLHEPAMRGDLFGRRGEVPGPIGEDVQVDVAGERLPAIIAAGEHWRIDQCFVADRAVADALGPAVRHV